MLSDPLFTIVNQYPAVLMTFGSGSFPRADALGSRVSLRSPLPAAAGSGFFLQLQHQLVHKVAVAHEVEAGVLVVQALVGARGIEDVQRFRYAATMPCFSSQMRSAPSTSSVTCSRLWLCSAS